MNGRQILDTFETQMGLEEQLVEFGKKQEERREGDWKKEREKRIDYFSFSSSPSKVRLIPMNILWRATCSTAKGKELTLSKSRKGKVEISPLSKRCDC